ncbi:MAG: hypothetical protein M0Z55_12725 [Peptococcaceae bacterium]|nr:hypothetical protein [Peptococcaceae bacterium]
MDKIKLKTEVPVLVIVTDNFKHKLIFDLQEKLRKIELEVQQLDFTSRRTLMDAERQGQLAQVQRQVDAQRQERVQLKQQLVEQVKQIARLQPGEEVLQGHVEAMVEIGIGDTWQYQNRVKIVLKDDRVVEIRRG